MSPEFLPIKWCEEHDSKALPDPATSPCDYALFLIAANDLRKIEGRDWEPIHGCRMIPAEVRRHDRDYSD